MNARVGCTIMVKGSLGGLLSLSLDFFWILLNYPTTFPGIAFFKYFGTFPVYTALYKGIAQISGLHCFDGNGQCICLDHLHRVTTCCANKPYYYR